MGRHQPIVAIPSRPDGAPAPPGLFGDDEEVAARLGERLRRLALGLTAALIVARLYWTGEDAPAGSGLGWVLAALVTFALAIVGAWLARTTLLRWSWADAAFLALVALVGISTTAAADRRPAITLAWEWAGLASVYLLLRNLPRGRDEARALAGIVMATAVALSAYAAYQVVVEYPVLRLAYLKNPERSLRLAGVPDTPSSRRQLEARLLGSREPTATFALANSLAGVLVGPAAVLMAAGIGALRRDGGRNQAQGRDGRATVGAILAAAVAWAGILACLLLTKSRSAYLGLLAAAAVLAWRHRRGVPTRGVVGIGLGLIAMVTALVIAAVATGQIDPQVLTEAPKSLQYRLDYWAGAWGILSDSPRVFLGGLGPGNFAGPYLRHKRFGASEEVVDPHNLILDVWTTAGILAALSLLAALGLGLREAFGLADESPSDASKTPGSAGGPRPVTSPGTGWLWAWGGLGGLALPIALGKLDPFSVERGDDLPRLIVLGLGWGLGAGLVRPLTRRSSLTGEAAGLGALAVAINLLAAGGIGIPPVALGLWSWIALAIVLRDDRPGGRLRGVGGRWWSFGLASVSAALIGSFHGAVSPLWRSEEAMGRAVAALAEATRARLGAHPDPERAEALVSEARRSYREAARVDPLSARPWLALGDLEYRSWIARGAPAPERFWHVVEPLLDAASAYPRDPNSLAVQRTRAELLRELIGRRGAGPPAGSPDLLSEEWARATARAVALYPTSAPLRASLAESLAALGRYDHAAREAREALRLDTTPHEDKKLAPDVRARLLAAEPRWAALARQTTPGSP